MVKPKYGISHYGLGLKYEPITNSSRPQEALGSAMAIIQASFIMVESPAVSLDYYYYFHSHLLEEQFPDSFTSYSYSPCQFIMYYCIVTGTSYCRYYYYYCNCFIMYILNILVMLVTS
jgi:hypothetical protein